MTESFPRLIADIGATNARFAVQSRADAELADLAVLPDADHASLEAAIRSYLAGHTRFSPRWCVVAIATPVNGDRVTMTNHPWSFSIAKLKAALGFDRLLVINDFTAQALAVPALQPSDLLSVGSGAMRPNATIALIGPGTGLGVGGLARNGRIAVPVVGEGGHVTLAATDAREVAILARLEQRFGHASAERALSGQGLENLFEACCHLDARSAPPLDASAVTERALAGSDAHCSEAVAHFFSFLGTTAGNLALTLGAHGGVYIGGGIVPRLATLIEASSFRRRFEAKGRFTDYLKVIATSVIVSTFPAGLIGAARSFDVFDTAD